MNPRQIRAMYIAEQLDDILSMISHLNRADLSTLDDDKEMQAAVHLDIMQIRRALRQLDDKINHR
jgi:uncharacterized protein with HEPN domain